MLHAADVVHCRARNLEGAHLDREKLEALQWKLQPFPDLYDDMCEVMELFDQAVGRRRQIPPPPGPETSMRTLDVRLRYVHWETHAVLFIAG